MIVSAGRTYWKLRRNKSFYAVGSSYSKSEMMLLQGNLRCPICLEAYTRPRSLSCLHCFCEGCLESVIRRNTDKFVEKKEIECPVCQTGTLAPAGAKTMGEWAKCLPIEYIVSPLPHDTLTESESARLCGHCAAAEEIVDAQNYCLECNNFLCRRCTRIHARLPPSKDHTVSNLSDVPKLQASSRKSFSFEFCTLHANEQIQFYCQDHSSMCCGTCIFIHRKCENVIKVQEQGQSVKERGHTQQLQTNMETVQAKVEGYTDMLENNVADIASNTETIKQTIKEMRDNVVKKMDQLVDDVSRKADQLRVDHRTSLAERISAQKSLTAAITTSLFMLDSVLQHGTETQIFIAVHKIEEQLRQYTDLQQEDQDIATTVHLQLKTSTELQHLTNTTDKLADIEVIQEKIEYIETDNQARLARIEDNSGSDVLEVDGRMDSTVKTQSDTNNLPPIADCRIEKVTMVDIVKREGNTENPAVADIAYLHDGRLVYVDHTNSLCCLMDDTYNVVADVKLPYAPLSVAVTRDSELVVATLGKQLHTLSVNNNTLTLTRTLSCNRQPRRLAKVSESDLMVGWYGEGVGVISLTDGTEKTYLDHDTSGAKIKIEERDYITLNKNRSRIYFTQRNPQNTLRCISLDGAPTFAYTDDQLTRTAGVALDRDGNVYVCCGSYSNNVHQISPDGVLIRTIDVGIWNPWSICFNNTGDQMAVVNNVDNIPILSLTNFALPM